MSETSEVDEGMASDSVENAVATRYKKERKWRMVVMLVEL